MNASEITSLFLPQMDCVNSILSEVAIERWSTKLELPSSKSHKVAGFQPLINAAMCSILDVAGFLDPPQTFTYKEKDGYFAWIINAISINKLHFNFELKY